MKIGFYVLGKKGYFALLKFVKVFGPECVSFVVSNHDNGVVYDWYDDIVALCNKKKICCFDYKREQAGIPQKDESFCFAIGWRWMIKDYKNLIVFHDSLLPKYRGFSPLVNMLINGEKEIGVTALLASTKYDQGNIIDQVSRKISYPITISEAIDKTIPLYTKLILKIALSIFSTGSFNSIPQDEFSASYSLWRDEYDYFINWSQKAEEIERFVDALGSPYHGAAAVLNGKFVRILAVEQFEDVNVENRNANIGKCIFFKENFPIVICGYGLIKITKIISEDGVDIKGNIPFRSRFESYEKRF